MSVGMGFAEILLILLSGGGLGPMLGMPPGPRDASLLNCPPANTIVYAEWAARGPGKEGAAGIEGLIADQEVQQFLTKVQAAIVEGVAAETEIGSPEEQVLGDVMPRLGFELIKHHGYMYLSYQEDNVVTGDTPQAMLTSLAQGMRFALIVNGEKQADKITADFLELTQFLPDGERRETLDRLELPLRIPGVPVLAHRHEDYFILAAGDGALDAAIAGLDGKSNGLVDDERFKSGVKKVEFQRSGGISWVDTRQVLKVAASVLEPTGVDVSGMATLVGLDSLDYVVTATGIDDGQISCRRFIATGGKTDGILKLASGRAITRDDVTQIPADDGFAFAARLDAAGILDEVRKILSAAGPGPAQALENALAEIERESGIAVEDDLFTAFGDVWTIYNSPSGGGWLFSGSILTLDVRDVAKSKITYFKIVEAFKRNLQGVNNNGFRARGVEVKSAEFLDRTIHYLNVVGDDDVPFTPAICLTPERLYIALHPQSIKAQLRFLDSKEKSFAAGFNDVLDPPKGELLSLTYWDAQTTVKLLYSLVPYFGQVILTNAQAEWAIDIDSFDIPSARAILPYVGPYTTTTVRTPEGILTTSTSALPIPVGSALGTMFPMIGFFRVQPAFRVQQRAIREAPAAPADELPR